MLRLVIATGDEKTYARYRSAGVSFLQSFYRQSTEAMGTAALLAGMRILESSALPGLRAARAVRSDHRSDGAGKGDAAVDPQVLQFGESLRRPYDLAACGESLSTEVVLLVGLHRVALEHEELREVASPFWPSPDTHETTDGTGHSPSDHHPIGGQSAGSSDELAAAFDARVALWREHIDPEQAARAAGCATLGDGPAEGGRRQPPQRAKELLQQAARMAQWADVAATARSLYAQSFQRNPPSGG